MSNCSANIRYEGITVFWVLQIVDEAFFLCGQLGVADDLIPLFNIHSSDKSGWLCLSKNILLSKISF